MAKRIAFNESASQIKLCSGAVTLQPRGAEGDHAELTEDQVKHGTVVLMSRARKIVVLTADEAASRLKKSAPSAPKEKAAPEKAKKAEKKTEPKEPEPKEPEPAPPPAVEPPPSTEKTEEKAADKSDDGKSDDKDAAPKRSKKKSRRR